MYGTKQPDRWLLKGQQPDGTPDGTGPTVPGTKVGYGVVPVTRSIYHLKQYHDYGKPFIVLVLETCVPVKHDSFSMVPSLEGV